MNCKNVTECACPKTTCPNHGQCCACVIKHRTTDSLPFCLFLDNEGNKSVENYYRKLKERFESNKSVSVSNENTDVTFPEKKHVYIGEV